MVVCAEAQGQGMKYQWKETPEAVLGDVGWGWTRRPCVRVQEPQSTELAPAGASHSTTQPRFRKASPAVSPETPQRSATTWTCRSPPQTFLRPVLTLSEPLALDVIDMIVHGLFLTSFF